MAASLLRLGRITGIDRPAIAIPMPTATGVTVLLDVGANSDCSPENLVQFALMGAVYAERVLGLAHPRVGLLNIGEEPTKGNALCLASLSAACRLRAQLHRQRGRTGHPPGRGRSDRLRRVRRQRRAQALAKACQRPVRPDQGDCRRLGQRKARGAPPPFQPASAARPPRLRRNTAARPLLGVDGVSIIAHGRSNARAIRNAIRAASKAAEEGLVGRNPPEPWPLQGRNKEDEVSELN